MFADNGVGLNSGLPLRKHSHNFAVGMQGSFKRKTKDDDEEVDVVIIIILMTRTPEPSHGGIC